MLRTRPPRLLFGSVLNLLRTPTLPRQRLNNRVGTLPKPLYGSPTRGKLTLTTIMKMNNIGVIRTYVPHNIRRHFNPKLIGNSLQYNKRPRATVTRRKNTSTLPYTILLFPYSMFRLFYTTNYHIPTTPPFTPDVPRGSHTSGGSIPLLILPPRV